MRRFITIILFSLSFFCADAQTKQFQPNRLFFVDLSLTKQKKLERQAELLVKENKTQKEISELDSLLLEYGETVESIWDIQGSGCSWYCGGGNYKISASSSLNDKTGIEYGAGNANDLSYQTAWVAGKNKGGVGEFLEYSFKNKSPRVTKIIISNGYMKSEGAWKNNNRVKKLKLLVNGKLLGFLNLDNSRTDQEFEVGTLGHNKDGSDLVLRFEIFEVYKGDKFDHTAITEIYFDGIDVH